MFLSKTQPKIRSKNAGKRNDFAEQYLNSKYWLSIYSAVGLSQHLLCASTGPRHFACLSYWLYTAS